MIRLLLVFSFMSFAISIGRLQSVGIRGRLLCFGKPANKIKVKLYDDDRGINADDLMKADITNSKGEFLLQGFTVEISAIDPKLNIYHNCNDGVKPCKRKITIWIPEEFISLGKIPKTVYDAGTIELSEKFQGEERDCIN